MNQTIEKLLGGEYENHMLPFFWQHGEDEETLRDYMRAISEANCGAVCVESRPHPDFCGEKWWADMGVILGEAGKRGMKVWILDDSHFPTGFANGAVKDKPAELHRQSVCAAPVTFEGGARTVSLLAEGMIPPEFKPANVMEQYILSGLLKDAPHFDDDKVIAVTAVNAESKETLFLPVPEKGEPLVFEKPEGTWTVYVIGLSRNCGPHREYINMLDPESVRILIDAVYEPHWAHYKEDFGKTIAGFFSDEPEIGNGHLYYFDNLLGTDQDLPFARTMPAELEKRLGSSWANLLYLLWENNADPDETARVRHAYMDAVTQLLRENFSRQIGAWCRAHGVKYIGHMIEDNNAHARTGSSLGHYFRGLDGQDMAGIDDIGGQVLPQGEDEPTQGMVGMSRDGEFYHYMMANLAASGAAIQPEKHGDAMCEIFGAYGWEEGVRLEKYLADHFLVNGINWFVPHAFSPAPFPDPDCPPHFYAHGHNPQYRHFAALMAYMNRIATLTSGGVRKASYAILYHGESEWMGEAMLSQKPARKLAEAQIEFDTLPSDVFAERERYHTQTGKTLKVNTQEYRALIVPKAAYITKEAAAAVSELTEKGCPVYFIEERPAGVTSGEVIGLDGLVGKLQQDIVFTPEEAHIRAMHYKGKAEVYFFVNEAAEPYRGSVRIPYDGPAYIYDAWENRIYDAGLKDGKMDIELLPLHSCLLILDEPDAAKLEKPAVCCGKEQVLTTWKRSLCRAIDYPEFEGAKEVTLPDELSKEEPFFSGYVRYETSLDCPEAPAAGAAGDGTCGSDKPCGSVVLEVTDAHEGVEVFVNGKSCGIQIAPPFVYNITPYLQKGENKVAIEVATTLERAMFELNKDNPQARMRGLKEPANPSGINGLVKLYFQ